MSNFKAFDEVLPHQPGEKTKVERSLPNAGAVALAIT